MRLKIQKLKAKRKEGGLENNSWYVSSHEETQLGSLIWRFSLKTLIYLYLNINYWLCRPLIRSPESHQQTRPPVSREGEGKPMVSLNIMEMVETLSLSLRLSNWERVPCRYARDLWPTWNINVDNWNIYPSIFMFLLWITLLFDICLICCVTVDRRKLFPLAKESLKVFVCAFVVCGGRVDRVV